MTGIPDENALAAAYNRGLAMEKSGDLEGAAAAYREVLALDPDDHGGAAVRLAAIGRGPVPDHAPPAYVATLFDQNAGAFDDILVEQLGYAVPMLLRERLDALGLGPWRRMLDLGCGTGLAGASLADRAGEITGVDLSEAMLDEAHERGVYEALYLGEAAGFLAEAGGDNATATGEVIGDAPGDAVWDLVTATDVLPYIGDLAPFFAGLGRVLAPGGVVAVSTETLAADAADARRYVVGRRHRFAHTLDYLTGLIAAHGLALVECRPVTVRHEEGAAVRGHLIIARSGG